MTFFLRHRTHLLVLFAITAAIGLSSCADTFTGYVELEPDAPTEDAASVQENYRQGHLPNRVVPTPGAEMRWPDTPTGPAASQQHLGGDASSPPLLSADSLETPPKPKPLIKRAIERF